MKMMACAVFVGEEVRFDEAPAPAAKVMNVIIGRDTFGQNPRNNSHLWLLEEL